MPGKAIGTTLGSFEDIVLEGPVKILKGGGKFGFKFDSTKGEVGGHVEEVVNKHLANAVKELNGGK
jgi:hypothetical protein